MTMGSRSHPETELEREGRNKIQIPDMWCGITVKLPRS